MTEESLISSAPAILAIGVGLWIVTLIGLSWATSDRATQLSKPWLRKTLLFVGFALGMWVLCESAMGMFHIQSFPTETYILLLFVFAALEILEGKRFLSAYLGLGVWHLAVIVFVLEGIFGIFLADSLIPRTQDEFDREIAVGWPYEIPRKKPEGTFRVFALADSFGQVHRSENYHYLVH
ncbi:MAG: hypothetical protein KC931_07225, partial [Candidatus Omnitrophica bacterium]|nr:hypothetical protein [Candidatus Omnitrophota bacterium]